MRGLETDHVISGPMRGLKKTTWGMYITQTNRQTDRHVDSMTDTAQRAESVKMSFCKIGLHFLEICAG